MLGVAMDPLKRWDDDDLAELITSEEDNGMDYFDRLPDSIILLILNQIGDVKALGRCCVVSHRLHSLVSLVDNVSVRVDCVLSDDPSIPSSSSSGASAAAEKTCNVLSHFARVVLGGLVRPIYALGQILSSTKFKRLSYTESYLSEVSHYSPSEVLKNFKEIRRLRIELPAGELGVNDGVLLKWKADFGSTINSCVILGASSVMSSSSPCLPAQMGRTIPSDLCGEEDNTNIHESFCANGNLKLRVVWTISSLIAASARHYLLQPIVSDHKTLELLDLTDADGQGVLSMNRRQLQELTVNPVSSSGSSQRTLMPALSMRLWYEPMLEIPCGMILNGATLVAILPSEVRPRDMVANGSCTNDLPSDLSWILGAFEEPYNSAAKMLMEKRSYCLEMNSF